MRIAGSRGRRDHLLAIWIVDGVERVTLFCATYSRNYGRKLGVSKREPLYGPRETLRTIIEANPDGPLSAFRRSATSDGTF